MTGCNQKHEKEKNRRTDRKREGAFYLWKKEGEDPPLGGEKDETFHLAWKERREGKEWNKAEG